MSGRYPSGQATRPTDQAPSGLGDTASVLNAWLRTQTEGVAETLAGEEVYAWRRYWAGYLAALQSVQKKASAIEARRAATGNTDAVHESAVPNGETPQ